MKNDRHLPDVNVLLALVWPRHDSHAAAHAWFTNSGHLAWATNPITQLGVLRLLTNPVVTQGAVSAATALDVLGEVTSHPGHEFWALDHAVTDALKPMARRLRGHQQWTDAVLLWHAIDRHGIFTTFDTGVKELATGELGRHVLILKPH